MRKQVVQVICLVLLALFISTGMVGAAAATPKAATPAAPGAPTTDFDVPAKSAILIDAKTGQVLYEKNADEQLPPASITKIMTLLLAMEAVEKKQVTLNDLVTISPYAMSMGGSQIFLSSKDRLPLGTMLEAVTMASANDGCVAVAEFLAGTEGNFVDKMNRRAKELGMNNTHFSNATGLPLADHYTTAHDIALMARQLIKYPEFRKWASTWHTTVQLADGVRGLSNTNSLLNQYPGLDGVKTGHTDEAGYCLAASAERAGLRLVSVVLGTKNEQARNAASAALLDYGFRAFAQKVLVEKNTPIKGVSVQKGTKTSVEAYTADDIKVSVIRGETPAYQQKIESLNKLAPVKKGEKVGELVLVQGNNELGRTDLLASQDVGKATFIFRFFNWIGDLFHQLFGKFSKKH